MQCRCCIDAAAPRHLPLAPFQSAQATHVFCAVLCRYVHGGQELLVNSLHVPYYRAGDFTGAAIGARHNLEVRSRPWSLG
jgi:hypothetical protein